MFLGKRVAEHLVIDPVIIDHQPALGNSSRPPRLENEGRLLLVALRQPAAHGASAKPVIFKEREFLQIVERDNLFARIPTKLSGIIKPERTACVRIEMPLDDFPDMGIQPLPGSCNLLSQFRRRVLGVHC